MFKFRNIDTFIPGKFERIGMLKGKRWYSEKNSTKTGLFKPQRYEHGDRKVFCANHYGEFMGFLIADNAGTDSCRAELAELSRYYPNIHKERNHGTPQFKRGCIIYSHLKTGEHLEPGCLVIDKFMYRQPQKVCELSQLDSKKSNVNDNIEVVIASIESKVRDFYESKKIYTPEFIENQVNINREKAIEMIIYDCLYGNNDRHDENWSMRVSDEGVELYTLYDNERILGLHENQRTIENSLENNNVEETSEERLFSRMKIPGDINKYSNYKDVLKYMINNYEDETKRILSKHLSKNTPEQIKMFLEKCEDLPQCYIEFGSQMYKSRYDFAKDLYIDGR